MCPCGRDVIGSATAVPGFQSTCTAKAILKELRVSPGYFALLKGQDERAATSAVYK